MRAKSEQLKDPSSIAAVNDVVGEEKDTTIRFRNYKPYDLSLTVKEHEIGSIVVKDTEIIAKSSRDETDVIKLELAQYNEEELNIVPKKANWDLKSQIEGRMNKLKRKTQRAIVDILREKLAERSDGEDDFEESVVAVLK